MKVVVIYLISDKSAVTPNTALQLDAPQAASPLSLNVKNIGLRMNIREKENLLFNEWKKKYSTSSFVIDGCPYPEIYGAEKRKVVFILKDGNLGEATPGDEYDQREELENHPTLWWSTMAKWCYFLGKPNASWADSKEIYDQASIRSALSRHCVVQLKKTWGGGSVSNESLTGHVANDRSEIVAQLSIYAPHFIVACGNGDQLSTIFDCTNENRAETTNGVGYWVIKLNGNHSHLIDYCHPSIRVGTKVKGLIAQGLASAISEIECTPAVYLHKRPPKNT